MNAGLRPGRGISKSPPAPADSGHCTQRSPGYNPDRTSTPSPMKITIAFLVLLASPAMSEPTTRCMDALCLNFQQEVSIRHQHVHRDTDASCLNFQQYVPMNHRHVHRNTDARSPRFQEFTPQRFPRR